MKTEEFASVLFKQVLPDLVSHARLEVLSSAYEVMHIYSGQYQRRGAKSESQIAKKENSYNPVLTRASVVLQCNCSARFRSLRGVSMRLSNLGMPKSGVAESQAESYATPSR